MKQAAFLGGVLALSLIGSYLTWTDDGTADAHADSVLVVRADSRDLRSVTWTDDDKTIVMTHPSDDHGAYVWFEVTERKEVKPTADAPAEGDDAAEGDDEAAEGDDGAEGEAGASDDAAAEAPEPVYETKVSRFVGNEAAGDLWTAFTPLYGKRELDAVSDDALKTFGLDDADVSIQMDLSGKPTELSLGAEAYGTRDRYARVDGKVYLLDDKDIRPLQFAATRLVERRLQPLAEDAIDTVTITRGSDTRTIVQKNAADRTAAYWADAATPDAKDVEAGTWLGKLFRMRIKSYAEQEPAGLQPLFTATVEGRDDGKPVSWPIALFQAEVDGQVAYFARPAYTRSLVELTKSLADEAIADVPNLFDGVTPSEDELQDEATPDEAPPVPDPRDMLVPARKE